MGAWLARKAYQSSDGLVLTGRNLSALTALETELKGMGVEVSVIVMDLSSPAGREALFDELKKRKITINCLVNNAGLGKTGDFAYQSPQNQLEIIEINIAGLTHLTRLFLGQIPQEGFRGILNVSSVGAFLPGPKTAVYYGSKAYVLSLSVALRRELYSQGIAVTAFCPSSLDTAFHTLAGNGGSSRMKFRESWVPLEKAAKLAWAGLRKNKPIVVPGLLNCIGSSIFRHLPPRISAWIFSKFS